MKKLLWAGFMSITMVAGAALDYVACPVNFTLTVQVQNSTTYYGSTATVLKPVIYRLTTDQLLTQLALDENELGNFDRTNFLPSTTLCFLIYPNDTSKNHFAAVFAGKELVDLSDVMTITGGESVGQGKYDTSTGLNESYQTTQFLTVNYDDTALSVGGLKFNLAGNVVMKTKDVLGTGGLTFSEAVSAKAKVQGSGKNWDTSLVMSGSFSFSGTGSVPF